MKIVHKLIISILVLLAVSSGVAKVMLAEQDVLFFSSFGFSTVAIIILGTIQMFGGILMIFRKTRIMGSGIVAATFALSAALLVMAQSWLFAVVTVAALLMLGVVIRQQLGVKAEGSG